MTTRRSTPRASTKTETPWFPIALACLFVVGCAADARRRNRLSETVRLQSFSFQVEGDNELYEPAKQAADAWSKAIGIPITVTPDGVVPIVLVETLNDGCGSDTARGCSYIVDDPSSSWTEIPTALHWSVRFGVLLHEMGHHLRGTSRSTAGGALAPGGQIHLAGVPHAVMAANRSLGDITLLPEDVAFVCAGNRVECPTLS